MLKTDTAHPIDATLRLTFDSHSDYARFNGDNRSMLDQFWLWHEAAGNQRDEARLKGICDFCVCQTDYTAKSQRNPPDSRFEHGADWWNSICDCGMSCLERSVFRTFVDEGGSEDGSSYHVGYHSRFRYWLERRLPNLVATQYENGRSPGEIENSIQYENIMGLSFESGRFDALFCMEILEHVPDYRLAMQEMARVLRTGGMAFLTFPWLGGTTYEHQVRAVMESDGSIRHILPPEYHGDPASSTGILSFRAFGWRILDDMRDAGFGRAFARFVFNPLHGYPSVLNPVIVGVK